jgi:hypothetical protein
MEQFEEKRLLRGRNHRIEINIRMNFKDMGWESVEWIHLA